jgi:hypothetical protein
MLVMPGYKANAKNTNIGISVDVGEALGKPKTSKGKKKTEYLHVSFIKKVLYLPVIINLLTLKQGQDK